MSRSFAVVLPWLSSPETARNLAGIVERLEGAGASEIWCVGSSDDRAFSRARLVNQVLPQIGADLVWIHDPSFVLPFSEIGAALARSREVAIQPFAAYRRLARAQTEAWLAGSRSIEDGELRPAAFGKASFVVEREVLLALGGLSEAFVGRADEGFELVRRLKRFFRDMASYDHVALELWSPRSALDAASRRDNQALHERLARAIEADVEHYLAERFSSSLPIERQRLAAVSRDRQKRAAFRATCPTPPPRFPAKLSGSIWGITALFNPAGYRSKRQNYAVFRERLAEQGLPLVALELAFDDAPFELGPGDAERLVQLRGRDVLWQKERLLNIALRELPVDCDKVVWLDADVLFQRADWVAAAAERLNEVVVVQPFTRSVRLLDGERERAIDDLPLGSGEHELLHGMAFGVEAKGVSSLGRYLEHGHSGYAWAARREVLDRHGLYDANVLGNGDLNIAHAMFGGARWLKTERLSDKARRHLEAWATSFHADVQGSVGSIDGTLFHLWHGKKADRRYLDRLEILITADYDPSSDLALDDHGVYRWASDKPELHAFCRDYFFNRREDAKSSLDSQLARHAEQRK